jgi:hypothetical protein
MGSVGVNFDEYARNVKGEDYFDFGIVPGQESSYCWGIKRKPFYRHLFNTNCIKTQNLRGNINICGTEFIVRR